MSSPEPPTSQGNSSYGSRASSPVPFAGVLERDLSNVVDYVVPVTLDGMTADPSHVLDDHNDRRVCVIYTGGTLGMRKRSDGSLAPERGYLTQQIYSMPEFQTPQLPKLTVIEWETLLDSSDVGPEDWGRLGDQIQENYRGYDGFVILHGTDTMAYTACALSFMLEHLAKPVILTGSMIPIGDVYNDARRNMIVSFIYASRFEVIPEVCIFFNNRLLRGNRATKIDTFALGAFVSPNYPPLGTLGTEIKLRTSLLLRPPRRPFRVSKNLNMNIIVVRLTPGFSDEVVRNMLREPLQGLVLELYGVGNAPSRRAGLLATIKEAIDRGVIVVTVSQCLRGSVNMDVYANGLRLKELGVVSGVDMTPIAAATKLAYLLGKRGLTKEQVKQYMGRDIRGEMTDPNVASRLGIDAPSAASGLFGED